MNMFENYPPEAQKVLFAAQKFLYCATWFDRTSDTLIVGPDGNQIPDSHIFDPSGDGSFKLPIEKDIYLFEIIERILLSTSHNELTEMIKDPKLVPFQRFVPEIANEFRKYDESIHRKEFVMK